MGGRTEDGAKHFSVVPSEETKGNKHKLCWGYVLKCFTEMVSPFFNQGSSASTSGDGWEAAISETDNNWRGGLQTVLVNSAISAFCKVNLLALQAELVLGLTLPPSLLLSPILPQWRAEVAKKRGRNLRWQFIRGQMFPLLSFAKAGNFPVLMRTLMLAVCWEDSPVTSKSAGLFGYITQTKWKTIFINRKIAKDISPVRNLGSMPTLCGGSVCPLHGSQLPATSPECSLGLQALCIRPSQNASFKICWEVEG